jgi:hypothetical protein
MAITPEMRAVDVSWSDDTIRIRFTLDRDEGMDMTELRNEIEAEVESDFLPDAHVTSEVVVLPVGVHIPLDETLNERNARVFARREN